VIRMKLVEDRILSRRGGGAPSRRVPEIKFRNSSILQDYIQAMKIMHTL